MGKNDGKLGRCLEEKANILKVGSHVFSTGHVGEVIFFSLDNQTVVSNSFQQQNILFSTCGVGGVVEFHFWNSHQINLFKKVSDGIFKLISFTFPHKFFQQ